MINDNTFYLYFFVLFRYTFLLPDFNNDELLLIPFDELSKNALYDIDFDISQV